MGLYDEDGGLEGGVVGVVDERLKILIIISVLIEINAWCNWQYYWADIFE